MKIQTIASGSTGNCYKIAEDGAALLIECGIPYKKIMEGCDFNIKTIQACLVSHGHNDHCKAVREMLKYGVECIMSDGTAAELALHGHYNLSVINPFTNYKTADYEIMGIPVKHDTTEPFGFLVKSKSSKLLYLSDTCYTQYNACGLTHLMIECNYIKDVIDKNLALGEINIDLRNRIVRTHFSLENVLEFLKKTDKSRLEEIHLLHMSRGNVDEKRCLTEVQKIAGCIVKIA